MAKQIRLLATYPNPGGGFFSPGTTITVSDAEANQLVQNKNASFDLTGGTTAFQPAPGSNLSPIENVPQSQTIAAGQTTTVMLPAGAVLGFNATQDVAGTREMVNPNGEVISTAAISAGDSAVGPFLLDTRVRFNVSFGTLTTKPGVTPGSLDSAPVFARIDSLNTGDDEEQEWTKVVRLAQRHSVKPISTPAGPMPNSSVILGNTGAPSDFLQYIETFPRDKLNAAVYLEFGNAADVVAGTAGTAPAAAATSLALTSTLAFTAAGYGVLTENQLAGNIMWFTYIPTNAGRPIKFMRRIVSHPAYSSGTAFAPTLTHGIPAGAAITAWGIRPLDAAEEIATFDAGPRRFEFDEQCLVEGGFRVSVDSAVAIHSGGQFKW